MLVYFEDALHQWLYTESHIPPTKQSHDSFWSAVCKNMCF